MPDGHGERRTFHRRGAVPPGGHDPGHGGELDHDTAEPLRQALDTTWPDGKRLLVDLTHLDFCDSTGLNVLLRGRLAIQESGGTLELVGLHPPVARMFHITGADRLFRLHTDLEAALATSQRP